MKWSDYFRLIIATSQGLYPTSVAKAPRFHARWFFCFFFPPLLVVFLRSDRRQSAPGELVLLRRISNLVLYLVDLCMDKKGDDAGHVEVDIYTDKFSDERIPRLQFRWRADPARLGVNAEEILFHKVCYQFISHIASKGSKHRHLEFPLHLCCFLIECI